MKKHGMIVELNTRNLMVGGNFRAVLMATTQRFCLLSFRISISYTLSLHYTSLTRDPKIGSDISSTLLLVFIILF